MSQPAAADIDELTTDGSMPAGQAAYDGTVAAPTPVVGPNGEAAAGGAPGSLLHRLRQPQTLISFAISLGILIFAVLRLDIGLGVVWRNARRADPALYALAFAVYYAGFPLRAYRWRSMLGRVGIDPAHGFPVPGTGGLVEIFLLSWFANCVVPAKLGDAYRSYLLKRRTGASFSTTLGTILAERLTDLTVLFVAMSAVGALLFHGGVPERATETFLLGLGLIVVAIVGLGVMWTSRHALQRRLPERVRQQYGRLHDAVFACLRRPGLFLAISIAIWLGEGLRLLLVARALGADVSFTTAMFVALMGSLLTTLPVTPAGLGLVEGATVAVLVAVIGMENDLAASIALLDRVIGYWSIVGIGFILYLRRARHGLG